MDHRGLWLAGGPDDQRRRASSGRQAGAAGGESDFSGVLRYLLRRCDHGGAEDFAECAMAKPNERILLKTYYDFIKIYMMTVVNALS